MSHSFIHESLNSSVDFPTYISWHTLSSDVTDKLKHGSVRITRSNKLEYTIKEENERGERAPLLESKEYLRSFELPALTQGVTWATAAFLLVNSALGAGVLNVPSAFEIGGGIFNTCILQFLMIFLLSCTMLVLAYCSDVAKCDSYHDVLKSMCGRRAQQLSAFTIMLTCYGICITFLIIIGDQFDRIFASMVDPTFCEYWYMNRHFTITVVAFVCVLPMCYFERLDFLKYASSLGIFAMIYPVLLTIYEYCMRSTVDIEFATTGPSLMNFITVLPMISFAYQTHEVVVPVYACMANRNIWDFFKATVAAMGILFVIYTIAGVFGYWTFGNKVPDDVMTSYEAKDPIVMIGNVALMIKMITTYPPIVVCGRGAVAGLYSELRGLTADQIMTGARSRLYFITTVWFLSSMLLSISTPNIGVAIKLLGCLAFFNVFIFPGFCLRSLVNNKEYDFGRKRIPMLVMAYFMICMGFIVFFIVTGDEIRKIAHPENKPKEVLCEPLNLNETTTMATYLTTLLTGNSDFLTTTPAYSFPHNASLFNSTF